MESLLSYTSFITLIGTTYWLANEYSQCSIPVDSEEECINSIPFIRNEIPHAIDYINSSNLLSEPNNAQSSQQLSGCFIQTVSNRIYWNLEFDGQAYRQLCKWSCNYKENNWG